MEERNPYLNPHFRRQIQQPDAPEPGNRVQTAVDILDHPLIPSPRKTFRDSFFFGTPPRGHTYYEVFRRVQENNLRVHFGAHVFNPPPPRPPQGGQFGTFWQEQDANKKKKKK